MTEWNGEERRGIPIHILNFIEEKIDAAFGKMEHLLHKHIGDEEQQIGAILTQLQHNVKRAEERHDALQASLTCYFDQQQTLEAAFLKRENGQPDLDGHRTDHEIRASFERWKREVREHVVTRIIEWASIALASWAGYVLWSAFVAGPKG